MYLLLKTGEATETPVKEYYVESEEIAEMEASATEAERHTANHTFKEVKQ